MPTLKATATSAAARERLIDLLLSDKQPQMMRARMLYDAIMSGQGEPDSVLGFLGAFFTRIEAIPSSSEGEKLKAQYEARLAELESGPVRPATFISRLNGKTSTKVPKVHVVTSDGQQRFPMLHEGVNPKELEPGATVLLDARGAVVLGCGPSMPEVGVEAEFLRHLPDSGHVEVRLHGDPLVLHASRTVLEAVEEGGVARGDAILVSPTREFAFRFIPGDGDRRHRFVDSEKIPDIVISRDIGNPHWVLGLLIRRMRLLMFRPDILERFELRPRFSVILTGPTGLGKTLHLKAFLSEFRGMLEERTGRTDLGSRVIRVKTSEILSEFLGRSDKQIEELFDDIHHLASQKLETSQGERVHLPVVIVLEEVEAIGRRRGTTFEGGIFDRIIGTFLQRLDDPTDDLGGLPILLISTTNRPDLLDPAFLRRLGARRAEFNKLGREDLAAILEKKLKPGYPYWGQNGSDPEELRRGLIDRVVSWLFSYNGDEPGIVEIVLRDGTRMVKHRRDFLSGAIIEQAVSNAIDEMAFSLEESDSQEPETGFTPECLMESFRRQIDGLAENLTAGNARDYLHLPDEENSVAAVNRLPGLGSRTPALLADELRGDGEEGRVST